MDRLLDAIDDIKEKITDAEYIKIMHELHVIYKNTHHPNPHVTSRVADNQEPVPTRPTYLPNINTISVSNGRNHNRHTILTLTMTS